MNTPTNHPTALTTEQIEKACHELAKAMKRAAELFSEVARVASEQMPPPDDIRKCLTISKGEGVGRNP